MSAEPLRLFHYTCHDGARGIDLDRYLRPNHHPWVDRPVVWLTDLDTPIRDALGLTSAYLHCDRTAVRFEVADTSTAVRWTRWARQNLDPDIRRLFELCAAGLRPAHWWVAFEPVPVMPRVEVPA